MTALSAAATVVEREAFCEEAEAGVAGARPDSRRARLEALLAACTDAARRQWLEALIAACPRLS